MIYGLSWPAPLNPPVAPPKNDTIPKVDEPLKLSGKVSPVFANTFNWIPLFIWFDADSKVVLALYVELPNVYETPL